MTEPIQPTGHKPAATTPASFTPATTVGPGGPDGPAAPTATAAGPAPQSPRKRGKLGRIIKWTFLIILLLLIGGGIFVWLNLNGIIERTVESQATAQLNLNTELEGARLSVFGGELNLDDLRIASPQGFTAPQMFSLDNADVNVKLGELRGDPVRVQKVTLNRPQLVIERTGNAFNFKRAMELMPQTPQKPADQAEPLKVVINELTVKDPTVVVRPGQINIPGLTLPKELTLTIPTVTLRDIGTGEGADNGAAVKDVIMQVITMMAASAANSGQLPAELQNLMNVDVQQVVSGLTDEARRRIVQALPGEAGQVVSKVLEDPNALLKDPGAVVGAEAERLKGLAADEAKKRLEGIIGGATGTTQPTTGPATQPADRVRQEAEKRINQGLEGLFNRDRKKRDADSGAKEQ